MDSFTTQSSTNQQIEPDEQGDDIHTRTGFDWLHHQFCVSINERLINKNVLGDTDAFSDGFENRKVTLQELASNIVSGFAYCAELTGPRNKENFVSTSVLSVDVDDGMTIDEALGHPFVQQYCSFLYTTSSHTPTAHRFRLGFVLQQPIRHADKARMASRSLALRLSGDPVVIDPARIFYGNTEAEGEWYDRGIPPAVLEQLISQSRGAVSSTAFPQGTHPSVQSALTLNGNDLIRVENGPSVALSQLRPHQRVHCPYHQDKRASAFVVTSRTGDRGIHCSACGATYWEAGYTSGYEFDSFDRWARMIAEHPGVEGEIDPVLDLLGIQEVRRPTVEFINQQFLSDFQVREGVTFIKSAKGTGKTEFLRRLRLKERDRVLLIGHRQSLIKSMCDRLGLNCYLMDDEREGGIERWQSRYGVCLDSLSKVKLDKPYDYVWIDESEQVLAHFLSDTMRDRRVEVMTRLIHILKNAKRVVSLDADLSWPTFHFMSTWRGLKSTPEVSLIINEFQRAHETLELVLKNQLIGDVVTAIKAGKKCYVTSNSKAAIDRIEKVLEEESPNLRMLKITADTSHIEKKAKEFIAAPATEARKYDVILSSPSLSTGIDITFEHDERYFEVFGLFEAQVLTHFECDQQISRVRHPRSVKVYISPRPFHFETNVSVVQADLLESTMFGHLLTGFDERGLAIHDTSDELLKLASLILSMQRSSINQLRQNFIRHITKQGWRVIDGEADKESASLGAALMRTGKTLLRDQQQEILLNANPVDDDEYRALTRRHEEREQLSDEESASYWRGSIERFYSSEITPELVSLDLDKKFRQKVILFEAVTNKTFRNLSQTVIAQRATSHGLHEIVLPNPHLKAMLIAELLSATPIFADSLFDTSAEVTTDDLGDFIVKCRELALQYQTQFKETFHADLDESPVRQVSTLLKKLGLGFKSRSSTTQGKKVYYYRLDSKLLQNLQTIVDRRKGRSTRESIEETRINPEFI